LLIQEIAIPPKSKKNLRKKAIFVHQREQTKQLTQFYCTFSSKYLLYIGGYRIFVSSEINNPRRISISSEKMKRKQCINADDLHFHSVWSLVSFRNTTSLSTAPLLSPQLTEVFSTIIHYKQQPI
jgi:hypothetical protein